MNTNLCPKCGTAMETHPVDVLLSKLIHSDEELKIGRLPTIKINTETLETETAIITILLLKPGMAEGLKREIEGACRPHKRSDN